MFAITGKNGRISVVRIGSLIAVLGVIVVIIALATFFIDQQARRSPLEIEPPSGALRLGQVNDGPTTRRQFYSLPMAIASIEEVVAYYDDRLAAMDNTDNPPDCVRSPGVGNSPAFARGNGIVPYQFLCLFDNSGFNTTQFTEVVIQPGVFHENPERNTEGLVIIQYEQHWSP